MTVRHRVAIFWRTSAEGGRKEPFSGRTYSTVVRLLGDDPPWEAGAAWSVVIDFDNEDSAAAPTHGTLRFLSENAPQDVLRPGITLQLYEGPRMTAEAVIE